MDNGVAIVAASVAIVVVVLAIGLYACREELQRVLKDSLTNANGDYDPARVFGYIPIWCGAFVFLALAGYDTWHRGTFNYMGYTAGLLSVGGTLAAAAAGVWIKRGTEPTPQPVVTTPPVTQPQDTDADKS